MHELIAFVAAGFALAGTPGPATLSVAAAGAAFGTRQGLGYMAGIVMGLVLVMGFAASGTAAILFAVPGAKPILTITAAAYFIYLAQRIATAPSLALNPDQSRRPSFWGGLLLSLVNPKGYAAMAALSSGFVLVHNRIELDVVMKMTVMVAVATTSLLTWLFGGAALSQFCRMPRTGRVINVIFALLLIISVAATMLL